MKEVNDHELEVWRRVEAWRVFNVPPPPVTHIFLCKTIATILCSKDYIVSRLHKEVYYEASFMKSTMKHQIEDFHARTIYGTSIIGIIERLS